MRTHGKDAFILPEHKDRARVERVAAVNRRESDVIKRRRNQRVTQLREQIRPNARHISRRPHFRAADFDPFIQKRVNALQDLLAAAINFFRQIFAVR